MCEFLEKGETVTAECYIKTLSKLKEALRKKRPGLWKDRSFLIHHDNASPHTADPTQRKMKE